MIVVSPVNIESRKGLGMRTGDTVRVWTKVEEKGKTRLQSFEGIVLGRKHGNEPGATFTVRRVSGGFGVEKIFPLYSPNIDKIEIVKRAKVRRSKLYHIRDKAAREIRRQMRRAQQVSLVTTSDMEEKALRQAQDEAQAKSADASSEEVVPEEKTPEPATTESSEQKTETPETEKLEESTKTE